jgi:hypothetical protein
MSLCAPLVPAKPYNWPFDGDLRPDNTCLLIIDMQVLWGCCRRCCPGASGLAAAGGRAGVGPGQHGCLEPGRWISVRRAATWTKWATTSR